MANSDNIGRPKGSPNKVTASIKEAYEKTFHALQTKQNDRHSLTNWAKKNETEFYKLATKLIPSEINAKVENTITQIEIIRREGTYIPPPDTIDGEIIEDETVVKIEKGV